MSRVNQHLQCRREWHFLKFFKQEVSLVLNSYFLLLSAAASRLRRDLLALSAQFLPPLLVAGDRGWIIGEEKAQQFLPLELTFTLRMERIKTLCYLINSASIQSSNNLLILIKLLAEALLIDKGGSTLILLIASVINPFQYEKRHFVFC